MTYLNVVEIESALRALASTYPDATSIVTCPQATHEGRTTSVLRIGTSATPASGAVLLLGGVHAREWVPPDALISLAADLLEAHQLGTGLAYGGAVFSAAQVRQVIDRVHVLVFPCVNPDGRHHSQTAEPMWRKNRRPHPSGGACVGVDLNRNFDFLWDHLHTFAADSGVNTSADPCNANTYRGPTSTSEPETQNVVWMLDSVPEISCLVDVHSAVPVILHSWGSDQNQTTIPEQTFTNRAFDPVRGRPDDTAYGEYLPPDRLDEIRALSQGMGESVKAVRGDEYGVEQAYGLYPTSGASDDYAFSRHIVDPGQGMVRGFTIECGHTFQPPWSEAEEVIREVSAGLVALCLSMSNGGASDVTSPAAGRDRIHSRS